MSTQEVIETMKANVSKLKKLLVAVIPKIKNDPANPIRSALKGAMF